VNPPGERSSKPRLILLAVILLGLFAVGSYFDISERLSIEAVQELVQSAGVWGALLFIAVFAIGEFLHVPGLVFVAAAILIYGKLVGFVLAYLGAIVSVSFSFAVVRRIGGTPLKQSTSPWLRRALTQLNQRPIRTVFVLRLFLWMAPPLNYVLALAPLKFSHYLIGSALGLVPPLALAALLFDWLITLL
jgi:uncharacterized membrane protein YdjX (TVP38/TMEM64 family)